MTTGAGQELWPGGEQHTRLRDVELGDADAYVRMRCDPVMMAELGGPLPREGIEDKVARDVRAVAAGSDWIKMIVPDEAAPDVVVIVGDDQHELFGADGIPAIGLFTGIC